MTDRQTKTDTVTDAHLAPRGTAGIGSAADTRAVRVLVAAALGFVLIGVLWPMISGRSTAVAQPAGAADAWVFFSHPSGAYARAIRLELTSADPARDILVTTDGSLPLPGAAVTYTHPIPLTTVATGVTVVRARAVLEDGSLGPVATATYAMGLEATLPIASLVLDPKDLWDEDLGIYENPLIRGRASERQGYLTFIGADGQTGFGTGVGVRIHGYQSRAYAKKSLRIYFRGAYGSARLRYPLYPGASVTSFDTLVLHSGGQDYAHPPLTNWTLLRNQLAAELALDLGVPATQSCAALLFLNGEPWGIVQIRERIDEDFLADHYGVTDADILDSPESALRDVIAGDREAWDSLMAYVEAHDLQDPAAYAVAASQIDVDNFIDYHILQIYSANTDWPAHNIQLYRPDAPGGQWQWLVWDSDNGFGAEGYSQVDSDMISHLLDGRHIETGGRDTLLFRGLLANADFRARFLSALADHLNTVLAPAHVIAEVDALATTLEPDIRYETLRWPGSTDWHANVQGVRDFATARPDHVRRHAVARFGLPGLMAVTIEAPTAGRGYVAVNGAIPATTPWQGTYFQGVPVMLTAVPTPGYVFAGWEPPSLPQGPVIALTESDAWTVSPRFVKAGADAVRPGDLAIVGVEIDQAGDVEGDVIELRVNRRGGLDLRGWRLTDNDTMAATDEGSLLFAQDAVLADIPFGTHIRIVATETAANAAHFREDDVTTWDRRLVLYAGNRHIDSATDPWFDLVAGDNLAVLSPGNSDAFADDIGVDFWGPNATVTTASFGILQHGVINGR